MRAAGGSCIPALSSRRSGISYLLGKGSPSQGHVTLLVPVPETLGLESQSIP